MTIFDKCRGFTDAKEAIEAGLYPYFVPLAGCDGTVAHFAGRDLIMAGSNNYLGLTTHPDVQQAAHDAIARFGTSCTGSRFLNGTLELHVQLEHELAEWVGKPSALVFSTGMHANLGTISALVGRRDVVILDKDDHASIVDGAKLSWGRVVRFQHGDAADLDRVLEALPDNVGKLVVVDGVFSMQGDIAPLPHLIDVVHRHKARLMVDDAHGLGVLCAGRGTAAHFGVTDGVDLVMGTFSKALASLGGFIAGDEDVIHYIKHHARSFIFSASIAPPNAAAALAALDVLRREPQRVERVLAIGARMRRAFSSMGFDIGPSATPIVPILIGDTNLTFQTWKALFDAGVFVNAAIPPAVPEGQQLLRTSFMATHTDDQLQTIIDAFERIGHQLGLLNG